jgi:hypothetical protein
MCGDLEFIAGIALIGILCFAGGHMFGELYGRKEEREIQKEKDREAYVDLEGLYLP